MNVKEGATVMMSFSTMSVVWLFLVDFCLFNLSFFIGNLIKRGTLVLSGKYLSLLVLCYICWFVASFTGRKFEQNSFKNYKAGLFCFAKSTLYIAYCISFAVVLLGVPGFSRIHIFSTCLGLFVLEYSVWSLYWYKFRDTTGRTVQERQTGQVGVTKSRFSFVLSAYDALLFLLAFFTANYIKRGELTLPPSYEVLFLILLGLWFSVSIATQKYRERSNKNYTLSLAQWIKAGGIMLALVAVVVFSFRLFYFSRFQSFGTICILMCYEALALRLYFLWRRGEAQSEDIESFDDVKKILGQEKLALDVDIEVLRQKLFEPVRDKLREKFSSSEMEFFDFIDKNVALEEILCMETAADNSRRSFSLTADEVPIRLMVNMQKVNDIRRINKYFLEVHRMLLPGGYFIGRAHTLKTHREWMFNKYPGYIVKYVYAVDFCINRVLPKLPVINKVYFALTNGRDRLISRAEVLGRLHFCGFEIVAEKTIDRRFCFIARKASQPAVNPNPTYGPFVELKRVGFNNEIVKVYKLRTMHPYSEYLQSYVFEKEGLRKGGKLENDFRLTGWGKVMRKLWLDELPMFYNWLKGELQLVGVRPLSMQYFSLYDDELQKMRGRVKPGLLPPFYADMPKTFEEICESERRYIHAFLNNPMKTQIIYFCKAFNNIVLQGARSK
jgi:hypothetical protein